MHAPCLTASTRQLMQSMKVTTAALAVAVAAGNIGHWSRSAVRVGEVDFWVSIFVAELTVAL